MPDYEDGFSGSDYQVSVKVYWLEYKANGSWHRETVRGYGALTALAQLVSRNEGCKVYARRPGQDKSHRSRVA
jgi:hypothetical protein